jgi:RNA polymerase sigma factor (sigma-70 family)
VALDTQSLVPHVTGGREDPPPRPRPLDGGEIDVDKAYRELAPRVLGYLRGAGAPDPENVLGEVFLSVVRRVDDFTGDEAAFRRWVFSIAHNRMVDAHRQRKRRPLVAVTELPEAPAAGTDPVDPTLVAALGRLPSDQRTVVVLRFVADLPLADVATVVDRSTEAVKKLQQRGLANLRRALDDDRNDA